MDCANLHTYWKNRLNKNSTKKITMLKKNKWASLGGGTILFGYQ